MERYVTDVEDVENEIYSFFPTPVYKDDNEVCEDPDVKHIIEPYKMKRSDLICDRAFCPLSGLSCREDCVFLSGHEHLTEDDPGSYVCLIANYMSNSKWGCVILEPVEED